MVGEGLTYLVDFIGAMRNARTGDMVLAKVHESAPGVRITYDVRARTPEGTFELVSDDNFRMSYRPAEGILLGSEGSETPRQDRRPHFPMTPPVLAMFSPLDLPIWGGPRDNRRVVSAEPDGPGRIRLILGPLEGPEDPLLGGYAVVDLELGVVLEMRYGDRDYVTTDIRTASWMPSF
ncbi:hypothetical protein GCM10023081_01610 [Arthrobacter ginkgonis]|uniref:Uncharacterized protein n=1 Tax=Arthrobacter ginkgonis TaxID=1630594 RepID=A0ABP7BRB7_9MICC